MNVRRFVLVVGLFLLPLLLLTFFLVYPTGLTVVAQTETAVSSSLTEISERSGLVASFTATSPDCHYSQAYRVYLCPDVRPAQVSQPNPVAAARAREMLGSGGLLLIPDSGNDRVMAFDPQTGDLVYADFIPTDSVNLFTPKNAILNAAGDTILVTDQIRDMVQAYDFSGQYLGVFAPAGGADPDIMDTITASTLRPNGNLLVAVTVGANAHAIAQFDTAGNYLGNFVAVGSGGLISPFDIFQRTADWLVGGINSNTIHRYDLNDGSYVVDLAAIDNFPEQIAAASNGNVLVANFMGDQEGVVELTAGGALVGVYNPAAIGGNRGVYELPNGNLLTTNGTGVYEIDRMGNVIDVKISGVSAQYIEFVAEGEAAMTLSKTVGEGTACATTQVITVTAGTAVTYCYTLTNNGQAILNLHSLVDSQLGPLLTDFPLVLPVTATTSLTVTAVITSDTINSATWTSHSVGGQVITVTDTAVVNLAPVYYLYLPVVQREE